MANYVLEHHGVKGQRWGIRRYQNDDGSLTSEGRKRYGIVESIKSYNTKQKKKKQLEKARVAKVEKKAAAEKRAEDLKKGKVPIKKMTDEEIKARIARLELEKTLKNLESETTQVAISKGKKFINKLVDSTADKVADNVGADLVAQTLKSYAAEYINKKAGSERVFANNKKKG